MNLRQLASIGEGKLPLRIARRGGHRMSPSAELDVVQDRDPGWRQVPLAQKQKTGNRFRDFAGLRGIVESEGPVASAAQAQAFRQYVELQARVVCGACQHCTGQLGLWPCG